MKDEENEERKGLRGMKERMRMERKIRAKRGRNEVIMREGKRK